MDLRLLEEHHSSQKDSIIQSTNLKNLCSWGFYFLLNKKRGYGNRKLIVSEGYHTLLSYSEVLQKVFFTMKWHFVKNKF